MWVWLLAALGSACAVPHTRARAVSHMRARACARTSHVPVHVVVEDLHQPQGLVHVEVQRQAPAQLVAELARRELAALRVSRGWFSV